jgi:thioredoxin-like negative regulator of GroEL
LLEDDDLEALEAQRIAEMKAEAMRLLENERKGHGQYQLVAEPDFLKEVTTSEKVVCHFFHNDFQRCKIVDKHFSVICRKYRGTKFIKVNAEESPFFVTKLKIKVLPTIIMFQKGIAVDRIVGFEELGGQDDFKQVRLERRLADRGMIVYKNEDMDSDEEEELRERRAGGLRGGALYSGSKLSKSHGDDSDEDW